MACRCIPILQPCHLTVPLQWPQSQDKTFEWSIKKRPYYRLAAKHEKKEDKVLDWLHISRWALKKDKYLWSGSRVAIYFRKTFRILQVSYKSHSTFSWWHFWCKIKALSLKFHRWTKAFQKNITKSYQLLYSLLIWKIITFYKHPRSQSITRLVSNWLEQVL